MKISGQPSVISHQTKGQKKGKNLLDRMRTGRIKNNKDFTMKDLKGMKSNMLGKGKIKIKSKN